MPPCVLVADSDPATRAAMVRPLLQAGYRVVEYDNPLRVLAHLRTAAAATPHLALVRRDPAQPLPLDRFFLAVRADAALSRRHRYICLDSAAAGPALGPAELAHLLGQLGVPLITTPCVPERLVALVGTLAAQLQVPSDRVSCA